jgi:hypothetical protein
MGGGLSAPVASAWRALSRAGALPRPRRRRRSAVPAPAGPVVARRYAPSGTAVAHSARVRLARPTAPGIVLPVEITVKGAPCARVAARSARAPPLEQ